MTAGDRSENEKKVKVIGIRRETINAWERRAPLNPSHVSQLVSRGVRVLVQPMDRRTHPMWEYVEAGAEEKEDLSEADVILSVKQVELGELLGDKTYCFFSHTIKAQTDNMPLLDEVLDKHVQLIDYEKMTNENGRRVVMFGKWAGRVGALDILHGMGLRLLALGFNTPFMNVALAHNYVDSRTAERSLNEVAKRIEQGDIPPSMGPLIFVITGTGNVSQGAQDILRCFPHEYISAKKLPEIAKFGSTKKIYLCVITRDDHLRRKDGNDNEEFSIPDYEAHPEHYESIFATQIAAYASVIINGICWQPHHPRLLTTADAEVLLQPRVSLGSSRMSPGHGHLPHRLVAICDISADPGGSLQFVQHCTTVDKPFFLYDYRHNTTDRFDPKHGVLICSIDNMPCQMAGEATKHFGDLLLPYVYQILNCRPDRPLHEQNGVSDVIKRAIIAQNGHLTPRFEYIARLRHNKAQSH